MNKKLMLCLTLLMGTASLHAQAASQDSSASKTVGGTPGPAMLEGCLQQTEGEYTVTDKTDVIHHLSGSTKLLKPYIGHEVQVTGTPSVRTVDATLAGGASSVIEEPVFKLKTVTDVSASCQTLAR